jgi:hypothetical protein
MCLCRPRAKKLHGWFAQLLGAVELRHEIDNFGFQFNELVVCIGRSWGHDRKSRNSWQGGNAGNDRAAG